MPKIRILNEHRQIKRVKHLEIFLANLVNLAHKKDYYFL